MSRYIDLIKNIGLFTLSNFAVKLVAFLLVPLYTYYLSTAEYGVTDMLTTTVNMLVPLATLSVADATLRFCVNKKGSAEAYSSVGFGVTVLSCLVVACLLPCLDLEIFGGLGEYKGGFLACYAAMALQIFFSNLSRGVGQVSVMAVASVMSSVANILCTVLTIAFFKWGVQGFFISLFLGNCIGCLWYLIPGHLYRFIRFRISDFKNNFKPMMVYALPLVPNALSWWMTQNINRFFITGIMGIAASGMFAAASKIPGLLKLLTSIFEQAWNLSAFQEFKSKGRQAFFNAIYRIYNAGLVLSLAVLIPLSSWLASFMLQKDFYSAWTLVPILLLSFYYSSISAFYGSIYTSSMKTRYLFVTTMIGACVCVILNYVLLSVFGLIGACLASAISNVVVLLLRKFNSLSILRIEDNNICEGTTQILLIVSAVMTMAQMRWWIAGTCFCFIAILALQIWKIEPIVMRILTSHAK